MKLRCLVLPILATAALAQPATPPKPAALEGKVFNSLTNDPLRKADVTLASSMGEDDMEEAMAMFAVVDDAAPSKPPTPKVEKKSFKATTDANGKFRFDNVDPGDYYLTATHVGFIDEHYKPGSHQGSEGKVHLAAADEVTGIVLRMTPHGAVSGRVQDEDGDPVPNAMVSAMSMDYSSGRRKLRAVDAAPTNDRGEYRLGKLPPGHYFISASALNVNPLGIVPPAPTDGSPETGYVSTYYPRTTDASLATKVDVAAAADIPGLTIQLQKSKVVRIKGQALMADGTPMKGGQVMLMAGSNPGSMQMGTLSPEGKFELAKIQPGPYTFMTVQIGGAKPSMTMQPIVVPEEGLSNLKIGAQTDKTIQGRIVVAGDSKVVTKGLSVMLSADENAAAMPAIGAVNEAGGFTLKVAAAAYELETNFIPQGTYLKSVQLNGHDVLGKPLDFAATAGELLITLGTDGGTVDATVTLSDKPVFDATVVLMRADPAQRVPEAGKEGSTDETGHVVLKDVAPGDYLLFAWEKVESGQWFDPDFLKSVEKQAVRVTVSPKATEKVALKAIPRV